MGYRGDRRPIPDSNGRSLDDVRSRLSGLHFAKEQLSDGETEILFLAECLLRYIDDDERAAERDVDLNAIEARAKAAGGGAWQVQVEHDEFDYDETLPGAGVSHTTEYIPYQAIRTIPDERGSWEVGRAHHEADAQFIAAASPAVVLQLVALARLAAGRRRPMTETAMPKVDRILWNRRGEDIDEIVISDVKMVHVEQMHDRSWWIGIYMPDGRRWSGNFTCDSRGRMGFSEQDCDIEWDEEGSHDR